MLRTLRFLLVKEFLQIRRDPVILRLLLVMPTQFCCMKMFTRKRPISFG